MNILAILFEKTGVLTLATLEGSAIVETGLSKINTALSKQLFEFFEYRHRLPSSAISRLEKWPHARVFDNATPVRGQLRQRSKFRATRNLSQFAALESRPGKCLSDQTHLLNIGACFTQKFDDSRRIPLHKPQQPMESIDYRSGLTVLS